MDYLHGASITILNNVLCMCEPGFLGGGGARELRDGRAGSVISCAISPLTNWNGLVTTTLES